MAIAHQFLYDEIVKLPPSKLSKVLSFVRYLEQEPDDIDQRILDLIAESNIPVVSLDTDADGKLIVDKCAYPDIYDWVVNG